MYLYFVFCIFLFIITGTSYEHHIILLDVGCALVVQVNCCHFLRSQQSLPHTVKTMLTVNHKSLCVLILLLGVASAKVAEQTCAVDGTCQQSSDNDSSLADEIASSESACVDMHANCGSWADTGECNINPLCT
jgi:hypothetical protein